MPSNRTRNRGFTLVELLIVLSVAAILATIAVPDLSDFIRNNRLATQINELQTSVMLARSEAVKRNSRVALCKSTNGTDCEDSGQAWENGWMVFVDDDGDGARDAGEDVLSVHGGLSGGNHLTFAAAQIAFAGNGLAVSGANGTFTLCDDRGADRAKGLTLGPTGRTRVVETGLSCS